MKYFVIHSGSDQKEVQELIIRWSEAHQRAQFVMLDGTQSDWIGDATARIRECGKILYIVGQSSASSENIQKELDIADKENKDIYVYKLAEDNQINPCLLRKGRASSVQSGEYQGESVISTTRQRVFVLSQAELGSRIDADCDEIEQILKGRGADDKQILMEQYRMFVQTSEDLVQRKQSVNTFYVTLNSLLLSAIVSVICAAGDILQAVGGQIPIYIISGFLSVVGIVICCSWITLLTSYSDLNASKMAIIGCIEEQLALRLYDTEWALLTRRLGKRKYRSFTVKELAVAKIFLFLYMMVIVACIVLSLV